MALLAQADTDNPFDRRFEEMETSENAQVQLAEDAKMASVWARNGNVEEVRLIILLFCCTESNFKLVGKSIFEWC